MIIQESGIKYNHNYIYCIFLRWGFKQKIPRKVHVNTALKEEKEDFKKKTEQILVDANTKEEERLYPSINRRILYFL